MYRRNTAGQHLGFCMVKAADGTADTGLTVAAYRCIDGGAQAAATGTVAEKANGQYDFAPSAADLNGNQVSFLFVAAGAIPVEKTIVTTAADPTDAAAFGLTAVPIKLAQAGLAPRALDAVADSALTVGDALACAIAGAAGKESVAGTSYVVKTPFTGTAIRAFTLDSATSPTSRS
jgi:hypothetical protein